MSPFCVQVRGIIVETGGTLLGPPGDETPKGQGGVPRWNGRATVCPLEAPPPACGVWERERGDSLPHRQKKRIAHRVSVDQPSLCAVYTKPVGRT